MEQQELVAPLLNADGSENKLRYEQAKVAARTLPVWILSSRKNVELVQDLQQEFWVYWLDPDVIEEGEPVAFAFYKVKCKLIDALRSRRYNFSYGGVVPHVSLDSCQYFRDDTVIARYGQASMSDRSLHRGLRRAFATKGYDEEQLIIGPLCEQFRGMVDERTWRVLWGSLVEGWAQRELGAEIGKSRSMVSKIRSAGIGRIRERIGIAG